MAAGVKFKAGDRVTDKASAGLRMTVISVSKAGVHCGWSEGSALKTKAWSPEALDLVMPPRRSAGARAKRPTSSKGVARDALATGNSRSI
jgi:uncharacterized protein YodC (DUF2158 family)